MTRQEASPPRPGPAGCFPSAERPLEEAAGTSWFTVGTCGTWFVWKRTADLEVGHNDDTREACIDLTANFMKYDEIKANCPSQKWV